MRTYARIDFGEVQELFSTDGDMKEMFHPALVWADITDVVPQPEQGWAASKSGSVWSFAPPA